MQQQVTLTMVSRKEKTSSKTGRPFTSLGIRTQEHGEKWLSGFGNKDNAAWKIGDKVEIIVEQKGEYLNFSMPTLVKTTQSDAIVARLENFITHKLEPMLVKMAAAIDRLEALGAQEAGEEKPEDWEPQFPDGERM